MNSLGSRTVLVMTLLAGIAGCGEDPPGLVDTEPGISGGVLAGRLEVLVVDEETRAPIASSVEVVDGAGRVVGSASGDGPFVFESAMLVAPLTVRVSGASRPQALIGLAAARAVIAVARAGSQRIVGRVLRAEALDPGAVVVSAVAPVTFVRTDALARATPVPCDPEAGGCGFHIDTAASGADTVVATLRDPSGRALGFGVASVASGSSELTLPTTPMPTLSLVLPPTPAPPPGLSAVVGVPGLATPSGVAFLDQTASIASELAVPDLAGMPGDPSWWILAEARGLVGERSVVIQRGLREPSAVREWPAWLAAPSASVTADGVVTLVPAAGATLHAVDWLSASGEVLASALVVDATAAIAFAPEVAATSIRVRAIDAPGAGATSLALTAAERSVVRFAEATIAAAP